MSSPLDDLPPPKAAANPLDSLPPPTTVTTHNPGGDVVTPTAAPQSPLATTVGAAEQIPAGIAGGVSSLHDALTGADPGTHRDLQFLQPHTAAGQELQRQLGQGTQAALNKLPSGPLADTLKERVPEALGAVGTVAPIVGAVGRFGRAALAGGGGEAAVDAAGAANAPTAGVEHPIAQVQRNGFEIAPNDIPRASSTPASEVPGSTRQGMTETPADTAARQQRNVIKSTNIAAQEIGLPPTDIITPRYTAAARLPAGAAYDRVGAAVGTIDKPATGAVDTLRSMATDNSAQAAPAQVRAQMGRMADGLESGTYSGPRLIQDISYLRTKGAYDAANALEDELGAQVKAKAPDMQDDYQGARQLFAKIRDVEDSLKGSVVDPQKLKQLRDGPQGRPLSGGLDDIAEAAAQAPNSVRLPGTVLAGDVPHTKTGVVTSLAKGAIKPFVPMPSQAQIAASARGGGPIPMGPYPRGLPTTGQGNLLGDALAGGGNYDLAPPEGQTPARPAARGPLGDQLSLQGPNGDLVPPEGTAPGRRPIGPTGPQTEADLPGAAILSPSPGRVGKLRRGARRASDDNGE